ncbi:MAG: hypothetical protein PHW32_02595 [Bacilli bacterium]|nr:hypothetical protein [Bacilli bacterium]MDD4718385.1 hypothetical protein [Bacilli bacterium]
MKKSGKKLVLFIYVVISILLVLEVRHFIKLREQVPSNQFKEQLEIIKSEFTLIENFYNNIDKNHEIYPELKFCVERKNAQEIISFFEKQENINYQNIEDLYMKNTGCLVSSYSDYYQKYNLGTIYDNNKSENEYFFKEKLLYNKSLKELVNTKFNDLILEISSFRESLELIVGDNLE